MPRESEASDDASTRDPAPRAIRGLRRRTSVERQRQQAPRVACAARAPPRTRGGRGRADRRFVGRAAARRAAQRSPAPRCPSSRRARTGDDRRIQRRIRAGGCGRGRVALRGVARRGARSLARERRKRRCGVNWRWRSNSGAVPPCTGSRIPRGSLPRRGGWRRFESTRSKSSSKLRSRLESIGRSCLRSFPPSRRIRSESGCGDS